MVGTNFGGYFLLSFILNQAKPCHWRCLQSGENTKIMDNDFQVLNYISTFI